MLPLGFWHCHSSGWCHCRSFSTPSLSFSASRSPM
ncbi:hypothetical protein 2011_scaffold13_00026 [Bacteriophage sp.]|nr:hypothetical protein 2011_scaffold13_00026 [Bacteriophage sp.]